MSQNDRELTIEESDALLEWINSFDCINPKINDFMGLKDGVAISTVLNSIDGTFFDLHPILPDKEGDNGWKSNIRNALESVAQYFEKVKGVPLETNVDIESIYDLNDSSPLIIVMRWVVVTILFCDRKEEYVKVILSLSSETQYYLQCIIETVLSAFPQDNVTNDALSTMHSILETSSINDEVYHRQNSGLAIDDDSILIDENSRIELHRHYEEEINGLENTIKDLQLMVANQKQENEVLKKEKESLLIEINRLEVELCIQKKAIIEERRQSITESKAVGDDRNSPAQERELLEKRVEMLNEESEHYKRELSREIQSREISETNYTKKRKDYEEEIKNLHNEIAILQSEKYTYEKNNEKIEMMKNRINQLKSVESELNELKKDHEVLLTQLEENSSKMQSTRSNTQDMQHLREEIGQLKGKLDAMMIDKTTKESLYSSLETENLSLKKELALLKSRIDEMKSSTEHTESIPLMSNSIDTILSNDSTTNELRKKLHVYIVENSSLRIQMEKEKSNYEESLKNKEEEYTIRKNTLESEYTKRIEENNQLQKRIRDLESSLEAEQSTCEEYKSIIGTQKGELDQYEKSIKEEKDRRVVIEKECEEYKRKYLAFENQAAEDRKKRKRISFGILYHAGSVTMYLEIDQKVIEREREVMFKSLNKMGNAAFAGAKDEVLRNSESLTFLRKSKRYE